MYRACFPCDFSSVQIQRYLHLSISDSGNSTHRHRLAVSDAYQHTRDQRLILTGGTWECLTEKAQFVLNPNSPFRHLILLALSIVEDRMDHK